MVRYSEVSTPVDRHLVYFEVMVTDLTLKVALKMGTIHNGRIRLTLYYYSTAYAVSNRYTYSSVFKL